ncbi:MAG: ComF family protein [Gammaproteobacteria bacterium]
MSTIRGAVERAASVLRAVLPPVCCLCRATGQAPGFDLCEVCVTLLPALERGSAWDPVIGHGILGRELFLYKYEYPVDHFIRALKFRGERAFARVLGELLAREHRASGMASPDCIVPMPLHASRYRERGFNQAREIARFAARSLAVRVDSRVLVRRLATREQSGLSLEARRENVRGAFEVVSAVPRGRIALLDDVVTTGSTAMAAAQALVAAGADEVELWAVARVQKEHEG